jgi:hypothetical protein
MMKNNDFSFSEDTTKREGASPAPAKSSPSQHQDHKPMHHLPRGKAWNPKILNKWWFWPASIGALIVLNLAVTLWKRFFDQ